MCIRNMREESNSRGFFRPHEALSIRFRGIKEKAWRSDPPLEPDQQTADQGQQDGDRQDTDKRVLVIL